MIAAIDVRGRRRPVVRVRRMGGDWTRCGLDDIPQAPAVALEWAHETARTYNAEMFPTEVLGSHGAVAYDWDDDVTWCAASAYYGGTDYLHTAYRVVCELVDDGAVVSLWSVYKGGDWYPVGSGRVGGGIRAVPLDVELGIIPDMGEPDECIYTDDEIQ